MLLSQMSMEERLQAMGVDQKGAKSGSAREPPKADTMSTLLSQGLQSHDKKILSVSVISLSLIHRHFLCTSQTMWKLLT